MKSFHILCVVLMAFCIAGCSSGSSGAPASGGGSGGGDEPNDTEAFNLLEGIEINYYFVEDDIGVNEDISFYAEISYGDNGQWDGVVDYVIDYELESAPGDWITVYDNQSAIEFDEDGEFGNLFVFDGLAAGAYNFRVTVGNFSATGTSILNVTGSHDLSASFDCSNPDAALGDVISFPITMYNNSDTAFEGGIHWLLDLNDNDTGYTTFYENDLAFALDANGSVLSGIDLLNVPVGEYAARFTLSSPADSTPDDNIYYYLGTVTVSPPAIIAPVGNN